MICDVGVVDARLVVRQRLHLTLERQLAHAATPLILTRRTAAFACILKPSPAR